MSVGKRLKTEHAGAKNGGGYWGNRAEAKHVSRRARRKQGRRLIRETLRQEFS